MKSNGKMKKRGKIGEIVENDPETQNDEICENDPKTQNDEIGENDEICEIDPETPFPILLIFLRGIKLD